MQPEFGQLERNGQCVAANDRELQQPQPASPAQDQCANTDQQIEHGGAIQHHWRQRTGDADACEQFIAVLSRVQAQRYDARPDPDECDAESQQ